MQRSGQAADREDIKRQAANGQSRIGSPGKHTQGKRLEMSDRAKQTLQCVHGSVLLICVCVNEVQVW